MASSTTPQPGQVFRSPLHGRPALYVRTEQRPGASEPEHLLVSVDTERRILTETWLAASESGLEEFPLVLDPEAPARLEKARTAYADLLRERKALVATMKEAIRLAPEHADALRDAYTAARG